jgi:hypothetical protein
MFGDPDVEVPVGGAGGVGVLLRHFLPALGVLGGLFAVGGLLKLFGFLLFLGLLVCPTS